MGMIGNTPYQGLVGTANLQDGAVTGPKISAAAAILEKLGYTPLNKAGDTLTGKLTLKANQYNNPDNTSGLDAQNSDIVNLNALYFNDLSTNDGEGINFARTNGNWDTLRAADGTLYFATNRSTGGAVDGVQVITSAGGQRIAGRLRIAQIVSGTDGAGIEFCPVGTGGNTSPFIRFFDFNATGGPDGSVVDDSNWMIGVDDTGVSSFKIVLAGQNNSSMPNEITGASAALEIDVNQLTYFRPKVSTYAATYGAGGVGGTTTNTLWNGGNVPAGTYMISCDLRLSPGNSDSDQVVLEARKGGSAISGAWCDICRNDSTYSGQGANPSDYYGLDDSGSFTAIVNCNGSESLTVVTYTTDPGDPGGANYQYGVRVFRIGA